MLDCLTDYIGVNGCSSTVPDSGRYINEMPGINLELISGLADDDQQDFNGVWDDVQTRAIRKFSRDVRAEMAKKYKLKSLTLNQDITKLIDTSSTTTASAQYRGIVLETRGEGDDFACSNLQRYDIQYVRFYATSQNDITVNIYDLDSGDLLSTTTLASASVTANAWNTVKILDSFEATRIFIAVDCTNFDTVEHNITDNRSAAWWNACYLDINGATASTGTPTTITEGVDAHGISPVFSLGCSFDKFICDNLKMFETAFMYCLAIELMDERIFSERLSRFTQFGANKAKENRQLFSIQYRGGMIDDIKEDGELAQVVAGINLNPQDICLECNDFVNYSTAPQV